MGHPTVSHPVKGQGGGLRDAGMCFSTERSRVEGSAVLPRPAGNETEVAYPARSAKNLTLPRKPHPLDGCPMFATSAYMGSTRLGEAPPLFATAE